MSQPEKMIQELIDMQEKLINDLQEISAKACNIVSKAFDIYREVKDENKTLKAEIERLAKLLEDSEADKWFLSERLKLLEDKRKLKKEEAKNNETQ